MQIRKLFDEERAVSPVIGVILMVAITVILAAVIGTFVLGLGDQVNNNAPQASIEFSYTDNGGSYGFTATHTGGDSLDANNLEIKSSTSGATLNKDPDSAGTLTAGNTVASGSGLNPGATVRVIWNNPSGGSSNVIAESTAPQ